MTPMMTTGRQMCMTNMTDQPTGKCPKWCATSWCSCATVSMRA